MTDVCICSATTVVSEQSFGQSPDVGTSANYAREDHTHGTPSNPVPTRTLTDQTANRNAGVVYTNNGTRWMHVIIQIKFNNNTGGIPYQYVNITSDSSNPPTTEVAGPVGELSCNAVALVNTGLEISAYIAPGLNYELNLVSGGGSPAIERWTEFLF